VLPVNLDLASAEIDPKAQDVASEIGIIGFS
jgi:hypothetical protein